MPNIICVQYVLYNIVEPYYGVVIKKINITKNQFVELFSNYFQSVRAKIINVVHCLISLKELTVILRPTEAEDRGSRKSVGVKKKTRTLSNESNHGGRIYIEGILWTDKIGSKEKIG